MVQARDVAGGVHFHSAAPAPGFSPAQLPGDVRGFVNRQAEIGVLDGLLVDQGAESDPLRVAVIVGTAGVGKTTLALKWAHRIRRSYPDGQLYINLRGYDPGDPVDSVEALGRFLRALDVPVERIPHGQEQRTDLFRSSVAERRVLIFLDNAASAAQIRPLLPGAASCLVVITSRNRMSGLVAQDGAYRMSVETLSQSESVKLLRKVLSGYRTGDSDADLAELARLCANLPLALRIAAERAAARPRMPLSDLIADLRDESGLWDALSVEETEEAGAVRTVFAWSYRALTPSAARMFRLLGLHPGPDFGLQAAAALADTTPLQARRLLDTLAGAHLLEESGHDRYQFHDLLRAYAIDQAQREESEESRLASLDRLLSWYLHSAVAAAQAGTGGSYSLPVVLSAPAGEVAVPTFGDYKAAIVWYENERENLLSAVKTAKVIGRRDIAWQIPAVLTMIIADRESADTWLPAQGLALEAVRESGDHYGEAITLDNLGIAHRHLFDLEKSEEFFSAALDAFAAIGDKFGQARAANGRGVVHIFAHRLDHAVADFTLALGLARELEHVTFTGFFTRNLGWALVERGDLDQAEPLLRQSAVTLREAGERLDECEALTLLASTLRRSGRVGEARDVAEQALAIAGEFDGTLFEALSLLELGRVELEMRTGAEALDLFQQAAAMFWRVGRLDLQAAAWDETGRTYLVLGRPDDAAEFHRRAAAAFRERGDHWQLALVLSNLAEALALGGERPEAQELRHEALWLLADFSDPPSRCEAC